MGFTRAPHDPTRLHTLHRLGIAPPKLAKLPVQQQIKLEFGAQSQGDERQSTSNSFAAVHESSIGTKRTSRDEMSRVPELCSIKNSRESDCGARENSSPGGKKAMLWRNNGIYVVS